MNGAAVGGGFELALACDLIVAGEQARFSLPEPRVGLAAIGGIGLQRLVRDLPWNLACDIALAGRELSAGEALQLGLVSAVTPLAELLACAHRYAARISAGAPLAVAATKATMRAAASAILQSVDSHEELPQVTTMWESADAREGVTAFVEKRSPVRRGK